MKKKIIIIISVILLILILIISSILLYINRKLKMINYEEITDIYTNDMEEKTQKTEEQLKKIKTIVLIGADGNDDETSNRSDTIMLVTINTEDKKISLVTVPRDTYTYIPDLNTWSKINIGYFHGGAKFVINTLNYNFGLNLNDYASVDSKNMVEIIDYIGGVEVNITEDEKNYINNMQYIKALRYTQHEYVKVEKSGNVLLNGDQALTHMRNRDDVNMDYGREVRNREVIQSLMKKISSLEVSKILELIDIVLPKITTNINITEYTKIMFYMLKDKDKYLNNITSVQVPNLSYCHDEYTWDGVWCLGTDYKKAEEDFIKYIYGK